MKALTITDNETLRLELVELDKKYFIRPNPSPQDQQEKGSSIIFDRAEDVHVYNLNGKVR